MNKQNVGGKLKALFAVRELFMVGLVLVAMLILTLISKNFLSFANIVSVLIGMVPLAIISIGMTVSLVMGTFDLSVGGIMALTGTLVGSFMLSGIPIGVAVILTLLIGGILGFINGFVITKIGVNPLIATFGMQSISRSIALVVSGGYSVTGLPKEFGFMGSVAFIRIPLMVWTMIALVIIGDIMLCKSHYLRQSYYIGGNPEAAKLSGINVDRVKMFVFVLSAICATVAGIIIASRLMAGTPTGGAGIELTAIAACVLGGASLSGGEGSVSGAALGVVFLALVSNTLVMMNVSIYWQGVVNGVILIVAVSLDMILKKRKELRAAKEV